MAAVSAWSSHSPESCAMLQLPGFLGCCRGGGRGRAISRLRTPATTASPGVTGSGMRHVAATLPGVALKGRRVCPAPVLSAGARRYLRAHPIMHAYHSMHSVTMRPRYWPQGEMADLSRPASSGTPASARCCRCGATLESTGTSAHATACTTACTTASSGNTVAQPETPLIPLWWERRPCAQRWSCWHQPRSPRR